MRKFYMKSFFWALILGVALTSGLHAKTYLEAVKGPIVADPDLGTSAPSLLDVFRYKFATEMGLGDVLPPELPVFDQNVKTKIPAFIEKDYDLSSVPDDLKEWFEKLQKEGQGLSADNIENAYSKTMVTFVKEKIDLENFQKLFLLQMLTQINLSKESVYFEMVKGKYVVRALSIDDAFSSSVNTEDMDRHVERANSLVFSHLNNQPLLPKLIALVNQWPARLKSYEQEFTQFFGANNPFYRELVLRAQALKNYVNSYPTHDIRKIYLMAFLPIIKFGMANANSMVKGGGSFLGKKNDMDLGFEVEFRKNVADFVQIIKGAGIARQQSPEKLLSAKEIIEKFPETDRLNAEKLIAFFDLGMPQAPKDLPQVNLPEIRKLEYKINVDMAKKGKYLPADDRLEKMKELFITYPELKNETKIAEVFYDFYLPDYDFVKQALTKRSQMGVYQRTLEGIKRYVTYELNNHLSMQDYHLITEIFVEMLSLKQDTSQDLVYSDMNKYRAFVRGFQTTSEWPYGTYEYLGSAYFYVPVVSKDGIVSIFDLNEGMGFYSGNKARSVDFLAVGTDESLDFDARRNETCKECKIHDQAHLSILGRFNKNQKTYEEKVRKIADLRAMMKEKFSGKEKLQAELAFFMEFHEQLTDRTDYYSNWKDLFKNSLQNDEHIKQKELVPSGKKDINSIEQWESYIAAAESLGLPLAGDTTIEKYRSFLLHENEGYKHLLSLYE